MKKRLNDEQFQKAVRSAGNLSQQTLNIAHGVLVKGQSQSEYARALGLSRGAISQAVSRVWDAHVRLALPQGYERVEAVLPKHQAFIVRRWAAEVETKKGQDEK